MKSDGKTGSPKSSAQPRGEQSDKPASAASRIARDAQAAMASGKTGIKAVRWRGPARYKSKTTR